MKVALIGASGFVGSAVLDELVQRHTVIAIVRNPGKVKRAENVIAVKANALDENDRSVISVEDMAVAIVDELENPKHIRQRFTVGYKFIHISLEWTQAISVACVFSR